ncbi:MAG TPA: hypothetical protein VI318_12230 [Baekduia sp.]
MSDPSVWNTPLRRGGVRAAGIVWLVAGVMVALVRAGSDTSRDIGYGVLAECRASWASQVPQLAVAAVGGSLLIVAADRRVVTPRVGIAAVAVLAVWVVVLIALPGAFDAVCVN